MDEERRFALNHAEKFAFNKRKRIYSIRSRAKDKRIIVNPKDMIIVVQCALDASSYDSSSYDGIDVEREERISGAFLAKFEERRDTWQT